jgi:hypothetical protein
MAQVIGAMVTNGGPHSAAKWSEATASHIVEIGEHLAGEKRSGAIKLQARIVDIMERHHLAVQTVERDKMKKDAARVGLPTVNPRDNTDIDAAVSEIVAAAKGTPWEADFDKPEAATHMRDLLTRHLRTNMHIERSWYADTNPDSPHSKAFRAMHHRGTKTAPTTSKGA